MSSDILYAVPGDTYSVEVAADSNGDVALRGKGVALTGDRHERNPEVELVENADGVGVGILRNDPADYTGSQSDYSSGDQAGIAELILTKAVVVCEADSGYTPTEGDKVKFGDGGDVVQVTGPTATGLGGAVTNNLGMDGSGNLETDNGTDIELNILDGIPFGIVFDTVIPDEFLADNKVAVATIR
jgi:hypothetical protein